MKRYNVHIPEEWPRELDALATKLEGEKQRWYNKITPAKLVRHAISKTLGLTLSSYDGLDQDDQEALRKVLKAKDKKKDKK
jgi:hypothetical protein